jgi:hypothetical protein
MLCMPAALGWLSVVLYMLGTMCNSYGMFSLYVVSMEVFPTTVRNSLSSVATTVGRVGAILAPQVPLLVRFLDVDDDGTLLSHPLPGTYDS